MWERTRVSTGKRAQVYRAHEVITNGEGAGQLSVRLRGNVELWRACVYKARQSTSKSDIRNWSQLSASVACAEYLINTREKFLQLHSAGEAGAEHLAKTFAFLLQVSLTMRHGEAHHALVASGRALALGSVQELVMDQGPRTGCTAHR